MVNRRSLADAVGAVRAKGRIRRALGAVQLGRDPQVSGRPDVQVKDLMVGDDFMLWSPEATTLLAGQGTLTIGDRVFIDSGALG